MKNHLKSELTPTCFVPKDKIVNKFLTICQENIASYYPSLTAL